MNESDESQPVIEHIALMLAYAAQKEQAANKFAKDFKKFVKWNLPDDATFDKWMRTIVMREFMQKEFERNGEKPNMLKYSMNESRLEVRYGKEIKKELENFKRRAPKGKIARVAKFIFHHGIFMTTVSPIEGLDIFNNALIGKMIQCTTDIMMPKVKEMLPADAVKKIIYRACVKELALLSKARAAQTEKSADIEDDGVNWSIIDGEALKHLCRNCVNLQMCREKKISPSNCEVDRGGKEILAAAGGIPVLKDFGAGLVMDKVILSVRRAGEVTEKIKAHFAKYTVRT